MEKNPEYGPDEAICCVTVQTLEMVVNVFLRIACEEQITVGGILSGTAWLFGDIVKAD